jgi:hypothetical protein
MAYLLCQIANITIHQLWGNDIFSFLSIILGYHQPIPEAKWLQNPHQEYIDGGGSLT